MRGARWVQSELLEAHPEADLRIYAIFSEFTTGDVGAKDRVRPEELLDDSRVTAYWDDAMLAGRWFDQNVTKLGAREGNPDRVEWDAFILYGPEADWGERGPSHISWGRTLYSERERLLRDLRRALSPAPGSR